jgi:hypothetical protein
VDRSQSSGTIITSDWQTTTAYQAILEMTAESLALFLSSGDRAVRPQLLELAGPVSPEVVI